MLLNLGFNCKYHNQSRTAGKSSMVSDLAYRNLGYKGGCSLLVTKQTCTTCTISTSRAQLVVNELHVKKMNIRYIVYALIGA